MRINYLWTLVNRHRFPPGWLIHFFLFFCLSLSFFLCFSLSPLSPLPSFAHSNRPFKSEMKARHSLMRITSVSSSSFDIPAGRRCENKFHSPRENSRESSIVREKRKGERLIFLESINSFSSRAYIFIKKKIEAYKISILVRSRRKKNYRKKELKK